MKLSTLLSFTLLSILSHSLFGQSVLDAYVTTALEHNIALKQENLSYEKSLATLREAKALFLPAVSLEARYSVARGGRTIDFPIGDLLNPVYQNLNLINGFGQAGNPDYPVIAEYPTLQNEQILFLREQEHETKVRAILPIFNTAILQNHQIQQEQVAVSKISVDIYQRELVKEVKIAYYQFGSAYEAQRLYENTLLLVQENLRTTQRLVEHHQATRDVLYAAEAQVKEIEQNLVQAKGDVRVARAYFNFLLNRPYDAEIELEPQSGMPDLMQEDAIRQTALQQREELLQLDHYIALADHQVRLNRGNLLPNLSIVGDYGFQGTEYSFTAADDFVMASAVLSWKLFDRPSNAKVQQAQIDEEMLRQQKLATKQQLGLQAVQAYSDHQTALEQIELVKARRQSAEAAFQLVRKKYEQGQANLIEFTDARTRLTNADQELILANYNFLQQQATLERVTASYPLP